MRLYYLNFTRLISFWFTFIKHFGLSWSKLFQNFVQGMLLVLQSEY
jgi:hypothetical protein